jgi:hypothetical protein
VMKINFVFSISRSLTICKLKIVLNIPFQFFTYTSTTVIINIHVSFMSIQFLVADLGMLAMKIDFVFLKEESSRSLYTNSKSYLIFHSNFYTHIDNSYN